MQRSKNNIDETTLMGNAVKAIDKRIGRGYNWITVKERKYKNLILLAKPNYKAKDGNIKKGIEIDGKHYTSKKI